MIVELGHFALILALCLSVVQTVFGLAGAQLNKSQWMAVARPAVAGQFVFTALAFGTLIYAFVQSDFSVKYVATTSNSALPTFYKVTAIWGAHEGSMLLWQLVLTLWSIAVAAFSRALPEVFVSRVLGTLGLVSVGFGLFILMTSNPFERMLPAAIDGADLNPLLQDPAFAIHPPMLYLGYVGMSVPFAFAVAAMLEGKIEAGWARWVRPWATFAWIFLTLGLSLGSWWAYYELGWGGWWFWDPVENSAFMPWIVGTALLHSLAVTEKRGLFKSWTLLLSIFAFSLSLVGTFLVRSGVLVSVHSFASDPARGMFILFFLAISVVGALSLYAWRAGRFRSDAGFALVSRESMLLANNALLVVAVGIVFLGTLFPLFIDFLQLPKVSIGSPWFDAMFLFPMFPLLAVMGFGMHASWKRAEFTSVKALLIVLAIASLVLGIAVPWMVFGSTSILTCVGVSLGLWVGLSALIDPVQRLRAGQSLAPAILGMSVAHFGLALFVVGVTFAKSYSDDRDVSLQPGTSAQLGEYSFAMNSMREVEGPNFSAIEAEITVSQDGEQLALLHPQKRIYRVQKNAMTEAGLLAGLGRDVLVALGEPLGAKGGNSQGEAWSVRLQYRPLVRFIWLGTLVMALGGIIAALDRRYRTVKVADVALTTTALAK
jgi:cytochrome c-type biogenesis protein CcmF